MNAPDRTLLAQAHSSQSAAQLGSLNICYAPLIDKTRKAIGTRLTLLSARGAAKATAGQLLEALNAVWPDSSAPVLVAPLDVTIDDTASSWQPPRNAIL